MLRKILPRFGALVALPAWVAVRACEPSWPEATAPRASSEEPATSAPRDRELVEKQPVCVASREWYAGDLGDAVLYRTRRVGSRLYVGYFVYWSTERPWGMGETSPALLSAVVTDAFYSHFLYVFPGFKDFTYGPGDIEGVGVAYEERSDGTLEVVGGVADDRRHGPVTLTPGDLVDAQGRVVFLTETWSHQLGARGAAAFADASDTAPRCYEGGELQELTDEVAQAFRLGTEGEPRRAKPAWRGIARPEGS